MEKRGLMRFFRISRPVNRGAKITFISLECVTALLAFLLAWHILDLPMWGALIVFIVSSFVNFIYFVNYNDNWNKLERN